MKIYLVSDIHVEYHKDYLLPNEPVDLVVLAGDIHSGENVLEVAARFQQATQAPAILVAGNHEFYKCDHQQQLDKLRHEASRLEQVFFLENDSVVINDVRFLGCTLWTNFALYGDDHALISKEEVKKFIADFSLIRVGNERFSPDHATVTFQNSLAWLEQQLSTEFEGKTVVVTHFSPHSAAIHPNFSAKNDPLTPYFTSDCSQLMRNYRIDAWIYGHTHYSVDKIVENGTRLVSNQRGYPNERWSYTRFKPRKILEI